MAPTMQRVMTGTLPPFCVTACIHSFRWKAADKHRRLRRYWNAPVRSAEDGQHGLEPCSSLHTASRSLREDAPDAMLQAEETLDTSDELSRISTESGSRRAFCQGFCRLFNLKLATLDAALAQETSLAETSPFPVVTVPFSQLKVQRKRPYIFGRDFTETDVGYGVFFLAMHMIAVVGGPLTFSWDALKLAVIGYLVTGWLGISLSYHRQLSHQSFRCPKPLEYFFAYCGVLAFEGDPVEWSKMHRWHHMHSDSAADRHSPRDGLLHSHIMWIFDEQLAGTRRDSRGNMKDSLTAPWFYRESPEFYGWIRKTYMNHQILQIVLLVAWGGLPAFVWGFVIRVLVTMHMTWLVNSVVHIWGTQPYKTNDESRNNWLVALLVFGDGWHNNHHAFQESAAHGLEWWEFDTSYYLVRSLEACGLAWDVKHPTEQQKARLRVRNPS